MSIQYDLFPNPPRDKQEESPLLHPRTVKRGTKTTEDLADLLSARSSFSSSDLKGILDGLSSLLYEQLRDGYHVYMEGVGTFSLTLTSNRPVTDKKEIRSPSIQVKDIKFLADKQLKKDLRSATVVRVSSTVEKESFDQERRYRRILSYVNQHQMINITTVMQINNCNHKSARTDLNSLLQEGKLNQLYFGRRKLYTLTNLKE